ncbi:MAG: Stk1 family PASTA domain-containing Ser/Thr kinase [Lachnospiraceae bacterium]|nr:Stk1 family PASTA domain-containing Ser/Thr kinase [Lachnospiraceae bacterium]
MIKIGMMIGDRYEVLEKIGTGGMSDVYKAKDHKLNRFVAAKILKQEFSENANFLSKFRIEAQAAAGLMHPNIVNVYDVGEENGVNYIIMELVEGITLKKYIEKKARLSVKEAISIAIQVSMGIEAAHNNHIIHRDIKPQNIIISKDGKVKVTDFGIAKAATSNTITSNVMGSVHYTSPEQARGGYSDERSDIYSLGITIFEMLTGRVPFNGDTTVAIAIKHIQEELPSPREFVPEIPVSVEQIVAKCCQKSPDRRYQNVGELLDDLKQSLMNPDEDFVKVVDPETKAGTRILTDEDMKQIKRQSEKRDSMEKSIRLKRVDEDDDDLDDDYVDDYDPKMEKVTTILAIVAAILIGLIIIFLVGKAFGLFQFGSGSGTETETAVTGQVPMIDVTGLEVEKARTRLSEINLDSEVTYVDSDKYKEGIVVSASANEGDMVDVNSVITLTVSAGANGVQVPSVTGKTEAEAKAELEKSGFVANISQDNSADVEAGKVISQDPAAGEKAPSGSAVTIHVSQGSEDSKSRVPEVMGLTEMDAVAALVEAGLQVGTVNPVYSEDTEEGLICYQSYTVGSYVDPGTYIDLRVSLGKEAATYSYSASITGPTAEEDGSFKEGTQVSITLVTADGKQLLQTNTSSFPVAVNFTHIASATGTLTMTYNVTTEATVTTDANGNQVTVPGSSTLKTITRSLQFTEE